MNKPNNTAIFDLDGTLTNYQGSIEPIWNDITPDTPYDLSSYYDEPGSLEESTRRSIHSRPGFWLSMEYFEDGRRLFEASKKIGFNNVILSKGIMDISTTWSEKIEWCNKHVPGTEVLLCSGNKDMVYGKVLIDDHAYLSWLENWPDGLAIIPERYYNKGIIHPRAIYYNGLNLDEVIDRMRRVLND